ncbi:hypothetical protein [Poseidonocella sp. HB161398]|uniref:hypothetical protein n=1 Tax=Poseidonocella sp. HB161398 TaxID=2320855 RepID=UPI0011097296|nr:hypothetical protein [Poseidonocella sp. HB161398]
MKELLELPWQIQVVIVGGYFGYIVAYSGKRSAHKSVDTLGIILCFGGISLLTFNSLEELVPKLMIVGIFDFSYLRGFIISGGAISSSLLSAVFWRRLLSAQVGQAIRKLSKSDDDGLYFGWETLIQHPNLEYNQLNVTLKSGRIIESYPLSRFDNLPNGCCLLGGDGSIGMYVTHITELDGTRREAKNIICDTEGARITFIPANEVSEVDFRRKIVKS